MEINCLTVKFKQDGDTTCLAIGDVVPGCQQRVDINLTGGDVIVDLDFEVSIDESVEIKGRISKNIVVALCERTDEELDAGMGEVSVTFSPNRRRRLVQVSLTAEEWVLNNGEYSLKILCGGSSVTPVIATFYTIRPEELCAIFRVEKVVMERDRSVDPEDTSRPVRLLLKHRILVEHYQGLIPCFKVLFHTNEGGFSRGCISILHKSAPDAPRVIDLVTPIEVSDIVMSCKHMMCMLGTLDHYFYSNDYLREDLDMALGPKSRVKFRSRENSEELPVGEGMQKLNALIGLDEIKAKMKTYVNLMKMDMMRKACGMAGLSLPLHSMFLGSPGTGKTTVAKIFGQLMEEAGVLSKGHVVVKERSSLIGENYGSAEKLIKEALKEAQGGILFIDEAYQLYDKNDPRDPGKDVIGALMTALSDTDRRDWMLILAGYEKPTLDLLKLNPGLESRIPEPNRFVFADFTEAQLLEVAKAYLCSHDFSLTPEAEQSLAAVIGEDYKHRDENFGNARYVVNLMETKVFQSMADRLSEVAAPSEDQLRLIEASDIPCASAPPRQQHRLGYAI